MKKHYIVVIMLGIFLFLLPSCMGWAQDAVAKHNELLGEAVSKGWISPDAAEKLKEEALKMAEASSGWLKGLLYSLAQFLGTVIAGGGAGFFMVQKHRGSIYNRNGQAPQS